MAISSENNRNDATGNDSTATYNYTFRITSEDHLRVTVKNPSTDAESTLTIDTDYTVSGVGDSSGGSITLVDAGQDWISASSYLDTNWTITIRRVVDITQETDIRNQGEFYPEVHEDAFDYSRFVDQQQQDEIDRSVKNPESIPTSTFSPTLPTDIATASVALVTNSSGNGFEIGPTTTEISNAQTYATNASASATLASQWATLTSGQVASTDYSSKAWAIGGTGVTDTASRGASKEWAVKTTGTVDTSDYSAKAWAVGGTGVTDTASRGAAKEWAIETASTVDGTDYSSKEYAIGTQIRGAAGSAKDWATYTSGLVSATEYSAKEYAQGTQVGTGGSAKDWATETASQVDSVDYSAKEYAIGTQTRGASGGGSAKDWAQYTAGTVDDTEYSAKYYAQQASSAVNSAFFRDVVYVDNTDSPITISDSDNGKLYSIDSSGGAITINLPTIAGLASLPFNVAFSLGTAGNTVTINRGGTDTIGGSGASSATLSAAGTGLQMAADTDGTPDNWATLDFGSIADGAVTPPKLSTAALGVILQENMIDNPEGYMIQEQSDPETPTAYNDDNYGPDQWNILTSANDVTVSRESDAPDGAAYSMKLDKSTAAGYFGMAQFKTSGDTIALRGEDVVFTVAVKTESSQVASVKLAILEWTGTADSITSDIVSTWAASPTWATNWTELVESTSQSLTDSFQEFTVTATVGASANNLAFVVFTDNSEASGDAIFVSAARAYQHDSALPYIRRADADERVRCLQYYWKMFGPEYFANGYFYSTTLVSGVIIYPSAMWRSPTVGFSATTGGLYDRPTSSAGTTTAISFSDTNRYRTSYSATAASASTAGYGTQFGVATSNWFEADGRL